MPAHLRVSLSDRPGALASLARALAAAGANVMAVAVVERSQGRALDDLVLEWPYERPFDAVVAAVGGCDGARLHGLRHVADVAASRDSDVLRQVTDAPQRGVETLVDALPHVLLADWAAVADAGWPREQVYGTAGSPLPLPDTAAMPDRPHASVVGDEAVLVLPVRRTPLRILVGRYTGPAFSRSEIDRTASLVDAAAGIIDLAYRSSLDARASAVTARVLDARLVAGSP